MPVYNLRGELRNHLFGRITEEILKLCFIGGKELRVASRFYMYGVGREITKACHLPFPILLACSISKLSITSRFLIVVLKRDIS